tara:strand:+ start:66 stop:326 length:261 start_codon:yes stop_codon:yes gene_type:complete
MAKAKGSPKTGGRKKGTKNKISADVKGMALEALSEVGGVAYLVEQARKENPAAFMQLVKALMPTTINGDGEDGAIAITAIVRKIIG